MNVHMRPPTVCVTTASLGKMKDQQIQTEMVETVDRDVQAGDIQQHQGVYLMRDQCRVHTKNLVWGQI